MERFEVGDLGGEKNGWAEGRKERSLWEMSFTRLELVWIKERVERLGWKLSFWERSVFGREKEF